MKTARRSLSVAVLSALAFSGLGLSASADEPGRTSYEKPRMAAVARGLMVQTTTSKPSTSLLKATDAALDSDARVAGSDKLTGKISTVDFTEEVPVAVAAEAAADLTKRSDVVWAAPDTLHRTQAVSPVPKNDLYFPEQRNLWDTATTSPAGGYSIKAPSMWRKTEGSPAVVVAVVDTGIRTEHEDLQGQLVDGYDMIGPDQVTFGPTPYEMAGDGNGWDSDPSDPGDWTTEGQCGEYEDGTPVPAANSSWHGTFVAGQIAATAGNGVGIAGAAPGVKVQPVRAIGHCGGWSSDIIAALTWASGGHIDGVVDNTTPADVVNLSLGLTYETKAERDQACAPYAVASAAGRTRDSVFIAAAGNDAYEANFAVPASCPGFVSVGATSTKGFSAWYSNIGTSVDISAPGGDTLAEGSTDSIRSLSNSGTTEAQPGISHYASHEGTSMAAPEVSAGAALLYSLGLTKASEVESALFASVSPFRARSSSYAKKQIEIEGDTYLFDLNCAGHKWCGRGTFDLSKVQAPLSGPSISGSPIIGEPLIATPGSWVGFPTGFGYEWFRGAASLGSGSTYYATAADVGSTLSVKVRSSTSAYAKFTAPSPETVTVPDGPTVTLTGLTKPKGYGSAQAVSVSVASGSGNVDGPVQIRRGSTVLATGNAVDGAAVLTIPGRSLVVGTNKIRAAFLGSGTDNPASSVSQNVKVTTKSSISTSLPKTVRKSKRAKLTVKVTAPGVTAPTGTVRVYDGNKRIMTFTLSSGYKGKRTVTLPKITKKGKHKIKVIYSGSTYVFGRTATIRTLKVK